ncbi:MAG: class I SAM-dependent methyltransferase [Candidatus Latescibacteria bacterium]|jgi:SAM-dependent methyltransferase|nr:class I SAM-dependent methyltransferase [Candidatus Latescibacterota bacterium]
MKNKDKWAPSKFVYKNGKLIASRDPNEVGIGSRLIADLIASFYDVNIKKYVKGKLIDLGCGKVPFYEAYKDYITDNICVDWENTLHNNKYLDFECDLTQNLPFEDGEFDTIILSDVLEHIPVPENLWSEMARILVKHGYILMNVPFYYWLHEAPHDYHRFTEYALRRSAESKGFVIHLLKPAGGTPEILADIFAKHLQLIPIFGKPIALGIQYIVYTFIKTSLGEIISKKTGKHFPLGYFMVAEKVE